MSVNNRGLFKNDDARKMLRNMAGVGSKPSGILASSPQLMNAVTETAMPKKETGQGRIVPVGQGQMQRTMGSPITMQRNAQYMAPPAGLMQMSQAAPSRMPQGPVAGMPTLQTEYAKGGPVGALLGAAVNVSKTAGSVAKNVPKNIVPITTYKGLKGVGAATLAGASTYYANPFTTEEFGDKAAGLNKDLQDTAAIARDAGDTEAGARAFITQLGGNPEGNVQEELNKIYSGISGKKIPVSQRNKVEGSIRAIVGATTMAAKGNDMQRIAAGLKAGAEQRLAMAQATAIAASKGKKTSEYTPERTYARVVEELIKSENAPRLGNGEGELDIERIKAMAMQVANATGGSSATSTSAISTSAPNAAQIKALRDNPSAENVALFDKYFKDFTSASKILG